MTYVFKYNPEKKAMMLGLYREGYGVNELARIFECDKTSILYHIARMNNPLVKKKVDRPSPREMMQKMVARKNREYKTYEQNVIRLLRGCGIIG